MIPLTRPTLPKLNTSFLRRVEDIFRTGMITNAKYVEEFERACAKLLGVKHIVAVSSGTSALILAMKLLELKGEVILPSFTFASGGHSLLWCGLEPVFADINPRTVNLDPAAIEKKITSRTSAIMPTHVFGNPCDISAIQRIAKKHKLKVIYDASHAFGSRYRGKSVADFGDISCFSMTPTKVFTTGEGGLLATNSARIAKRAKLGRNNGDSFNREEEFLGISARFVELPAILGLENLKLYKKSMKRRLQIVALYKKELRTVPGISFQEITPGCTSVYKDMAIMVDEKQYGRKRDELLRHLLRSGVETKTYFYPALHRKIVYKKYRNVALPNTELVSNSILSLPLYAHMPQKEVLEVCRVIKDFAKK